MPSARHIVHQVTKIQLKKKIGLKDLFNKYSPSWYYFNGLHMQKYIDKIRRLGIKTKMVSIHQTKIIDLQQRDQV